MDNREKLTQMALHMDLEPAEEVHGRPPACFVPQGQAGKPEVAQRPRTRKAARQAALGIYHAQKPDGSTIPLLKTLLTSACERDCHYCPFRSGRDMARYTFKPEEMATAFMQLHRAGIAEGIFLSSGIVRGAVTTQDKLLDTASILREKHQYRGYLHLKLMPGAEKAQIYRAMTLADRLSINLEAPNPRRLAEIAPRKTFFAELVRPLQLVHAIRSELPAREGWNGRWPSTTTQFVVGGAGETDVEILSTTAYLTAQLRLQRAYFSAFRPIRDTPLENQPPENPQRQHRLYQTSFLFRDYGFELEELPFDQEGNLPLHIDPKLAWAQRNLSENPVEINQAAREELLRVPGLGPVGTRTVLQARRQGRIREERHLQQLGIRTRQMQPFVLLDGRRPTYQLPLFPVKKEK
jgi:predicted DNA-binding helix-hairpin-helix protein